MGLSAGFIEPLEATSIAQTLNQLAYFGDLLRDCGYVVPNQLRQDFNSQNAAYWQGLLEFILLHYESPRRDTTFWRDVAAMNRPPHYQELLRTFQFRTPRDADFAGNMAGKKLMFGAISWMIVGAPLDVITPNSAEWELEQLTNQDPEQLLRQSKAIGIVPLDEHSTESSTVNQTRGLKSVRHEPRS